MKILYYVYVLSIVSILINACSQNNGSSHTININATVQMPVGDDIRQYEFALKHVKIQVFSDNKELATDLKAYEDRESLVVDLQPYLKYKVIVSYLDAYNNTLFIGETDGVYFITTSDADFTVIMKPTWRVVDSVGTELSNQKFIIATSIELTDECAEYYTLSDYHIVMSHIATNYSLPITTNTTNIGPILDYDKFNDVDNFRHYEGVYSSKVKLTAGDGFIQIKDMNGNLYLLSINDINEISTINVCSNAKNVTTSGKTLYIIDASNVLKTYEVEFYNFSMSLKYLDETLLNCLGNQTINKFIANNNKQYFLLTKEGKVLAWNGENILEIPTVSYPTDISCNKNKLAVLCADDCVRVYDLDLPSNTKSYPTADEPKNIQYVGENILFSTYERELHLIDTARVRNIDLVIYYKGSQVPVDWIGSKISSNDPEISYYTIHSNGGGYLVQIPLELPDAARIVKSLIPIDTVAVYIEPKIAYSRATDGDASYLGFCAYLFGAELDLVNVPVSWEIIKQPTHANLNIFEINSGVILDSDFTHYYRSKIHNYDSNGNEIGNYPGEACVRFTFGDEEVVQCRNTTFEQPLRIERFYPDINYYQIEDNIFKIFDPSCSNNASTTMSIKYEVQSSFNCTLSYSGENIFIDPFYSPFNVEFPTTTTTYQLTCSDDYLQQVDVAQFVVDLLPCPPVPGSGGSGTGSTGTH